MNKRKRSEPLLRLTRGRAVRAVSKAADSISASLGAILARLSSGKNSNSDKTNEPENKK